MSLILQDQLTLSTKTKEQVEKNTQDIAKNTQDIQDLEDKLAVVYKFKGSVDTYADLPTENNQTGDVWDVKADDMNYAWTADGEWDQLGPTVDLSGYVPTSRTINNKTLESDITLEPSDIGAATAAQGELADTALQSEDLKTINGTSIVGEGDIVITTNYSFKDTWTTDSTTNTFLNDVYTDEDAIPGMTYLGELTCSDLPTGLNNAEALVEVMPSATAAEKVIHVVITSGNLSPYRWELTYWVIGNTPHNSGWIAFQPLLTAGNGITLTNNTVTNTLATNEGKLDPNAFTELTAFEELKANVYKIPAVPRVNGSTTNQSKQWLNFTVYPNLYYKSAAQENFLTIDEDFAQELVIRGSDDIEIRLPFDITRKGLDKEYYPFRYSLYFKLQRETEADDGVIMCADYPNGDKFFKLYIENSKIKAIFGNGTEWDNTTIVASEEDYLNDAIYNGFIEIDIKSDSEIAEGSTNTFNLIMSDIEDQENSISLNAEGFKHPDTYRLYFSRNLEDGSSWWGGNIPMEDLHFTNSEYSIIWSCLTIADMKKAASTSLSNLDSIGQAVLDAKQDSLTTGTGIDITDGTISVTAPTLTNLSTNAEGLVVGSVGTTQGALIAYGCTAIGKGINAVGPSQVLIGNRVESKIGYSSAIATTVIGAHAKSSAHGNIALGAGCNNTEAGTFKVSLSTTGAIESFTTYTVLDSNGRIPVERLGEIIILGEDDPTENTEGTLGLIYKNTLTGELFRCSAIEEGTSTKLYTWVKLVDASNTYSKAEIDAMIGNIETRLAQV